MDKYIGLFEGEDSLRRVLEWKIKRILKWFCFIGISSSFSFKMYAAITIWAFKFIPQVV